MADKELSIESITHPEYETDALNWFKWRLLMEGGRWFIDHYLEKFSTREEAKDYEIRKRVTYNPSFAKAAITEVKNGIYQRMADIKRTGGSASYQDCLQNGVDASGKSMTNFIGCEVLPELMTMRKVGVFVDMPILEGPSLYESMGAHPYLYIYRAEDIRAWVYQDHTSKVFAKLLLRDSVYENEEIFGYPVETKVQYRQIWREPDDGKVHVQIYNDNNEKVDDEVILNIPEIPFVLFELSESLLKEIADYQIALLNMSSSDINYILKANFPFYTEQYSPIAEISAYQRNAYDVPKPTDPGCLSFGINPDTGQPFPPPPNFAGTAGQAAKADAQEIKVGASGGRRYPQNMERPAFIHPSSEPLTASMAKQEQMKAEIRLLLNLSISNLRPIRQSADSKVADERPLENGLAYIGLELQQGENRIARYWDMYEGQKNVGTVFYPETYEIVPEEQRQAQAEKNLTFIDKIPSLTYQKEMGKNIVKTLLGNRVSPDTLDTMLSEIDKTVSMNSDPDVIASDVTQGLVGSETASLLRGYPKGEAEIASKERVERLKEIAVAQAVGQGAARGAADASPTASANDKKMPNSDGTPQKQRGEGK